MPAQGDVVLVPVPFSDLSSNKRRPVIVMSNDEYQRATADFVAVALTSQPIASRHGFTITSADMAIGVLKRPSQVRADKVYTLAQSIIIHRFGRVNSAVLDRIRMLVGQLFSPTP